MLFTLRRAGCAKYGGRIGFEPFRFHFNLTLATHSIAAGLYSAQSGFQLALLQLEARLQAFGHRLLLHCIHARDSAHA